MAASVACTVPCVWIAANVPRGVVDDPGVEQEGVNDLLEAVDAVGIQRQEGVLRVGLLYFGAICSCLPTMRRMVWPCWGRVGESLDCFLNRPRHRCSDMCVRIVPF
jgi:hypothetical protein